MKEYERILLAMHPEISHIIDIPSEILRKCKRMDRLIKRANPRKGLVSSQLIALIVDQWNCEHTETMADVK